MNAPKRFRSNEEVTIDVESQTRGNFEDLPGPHHDHMEKATCGLCGKVFPANNSKYRKHLGYCAKVQEMIREPKTSAVSDLPHTKVSIFYPTSSEMENFCEYIDALQDKFGDNLPIAKIVPPSGYSATLDCTKLSKVEFRKFEARWKKVGAKLVHTWKDDQISKGSKLSDASHDVSVHEIGDSGIFMYTASNISKKTLTSFIKNAKLSTHDSESSAENLFWTNLANNTSSYMDGISGCPILKPKGLDMSSLGSILEEDPIPGVTHPFVYVGEWESFSGMHTEDQDLLSVNEIKGGEGKVWYGVAQRYAAKLEKAVAEIVKEEYERCPAFMRHKCIIISPKFLRSNGLPFTKAIQRAGEIMVTFPRAYHQVFNLGTNLAMAVNFATKNWIENGVRASSCLCNDGNQPLLQMGKYVLKHLGAAVYSAFVAKKF